jgi:hypothetical protein
MRSYYLLLDAVEEAAEAAQGAVAFKGTEPGLADFESWIEAMGARTVAFRGQYHRIVSEGVPAHSRTSLLEKFPIIERKIPGALGLREAMNEASRALRFQEAYLARYGELAMTPIPLRVYRWGEEATTRVTKILAGHLSDTAMSAIAESMGTGLGCYLYFYPGKTSPIRVSHLEHEAVGPKEPFSLRSRKLAEELDTESVVQSWTTLLARMLVLGFVPKDPSSVLSGDCLQIQNATIDGGFTDMDSVVALADIRSDAMAKEAIRASLLELTRTVSVLLMGRSGLQASFQLQVPEVFTWVRNQVIRAVTYESRRGSVDPRVAAVLLPESSWQGLANTLVRLFD